MKKALKIITAIVLLGLVVFSPIIKTGNKVYQQSEDYFGYKSGENEFTSTQHNSFDFKFADKPGTLNEIELLSSYAKEISDRSRKSIFYIVLFEKILGEKSYAFGNFEIIRYNGDFRENMVFINRDYKMPEPDAQEIVKISVCKTYENTAALDEQIKYAQENPVDFIKKREENTPSILDIGNKESIKKFIDNLMINGNINSFYEEIKHNAAVRDFLDKSEIEDEKALYFKVYFKDKTIPFCIGIYPY